ncbi:hypothetical protein PoB_006489000 [Plakobranchus ocellatus]|uniref:Uncharacterized protein n=1 Tax=Plakobranchus ocellatus TaxID=259542 RepID=A0AAV4D329_9GAST|nr:hypothetical protein PoB_006489000 [Plakobranchus ocellatus]
MQCLSFETGQSGASVGGSELLLTRVAAIMAANVVDRKENGGARRFTGTTYAVNVVLEVIDDGRQWFIFSCLRPKASSSKQAGEVWVFPNTPDESLVTPVTDTITRLSDPVVDPIKGTYTFV